VPGLFKSGRGRALACESASLPFPLMSTPRAAIPNGTYFIHSRHAERIYLRFVDDSSNLTTWHFSGEEDEQWKLVGTDPSRAEVSYSLQNVRRQTFAGPPNQANSTYAYVEQGRSAFPWYINGSLETYVQISPTRNFAEALNVANGLTTDNNPVIMRPPDAGGEWLFRPVSGTSARSGLSTTDRLIIASSILGFILGVVSLAVVCVQVRRKRRQAQLVAQDGGSSPRI